MAITHGWTSAASPDGSDVTPTNMNAHTIANDTVTEAQLSVSDNTTKNVSASAHGFAPKGDGTTTKFLNANGAYSSVIPDVVQHATNYTASATTNAVTVSAPTKATLVVIQSEARAATSVDQTNVTWTSIHSSNSGTNYFQVFAGAITGAAGTTVTANFALSTKSSISFVEFEYTPITTGGTATTSNGSSDLLITANVTNGQLCVFGRTIYNADVTAITTHLPFASLTQFSCVPLGLVFWRKPSMAIRFSTNTGYNVIVPLS